jgi:hypothetical protein
METIKLTFFSLFFGLILLIGNSNNADSVNIINPDRKIIAAIETKLEVIKLNNELCPSNDRNRNITYIELNDSSRFMKLINAIGSEKTPYYDSANFDNITRYEYCSPLDIKTLKLKSIYPKIDNEIRYVSVNDDGKPPYNYYLTKDDYKVALSHKLQLSELFISIILVVYIGDNEMESLLINYDFYGNLIDYQLISYDEIAESCSRAESLINKRRITKFDMDFCYTIKTDTTKYLINNKGLITASN